MLGKNPFKELAIYALTCLTNPISNAVVERTFSQVTAVKTNLRNRMSVNLLNALVRIRSKLHFESKCCRDMIVTKRMLELFNTKQMYEASQSKNIASSSNINIYQRENDPDSDGEADLYLEF